MHRDSTLELLNNLPCRSAITLHTCTANVLELYLAPCMTYEDVDLWQHLCCYAAAFDFILSELQAKNQANACGRLISLRMSHTWRVLHLLITVLYCNSLHLRLLCLPWPCYLEPSQAVH